MGNLGSGNMDKQVEAENTYIVVIRVMLVRPLG